MRKSLKIRELEQRVEFLEFQLCQGNHDYVVVDECEIIEMHFDTTRVIYKKCKKCHKKITETSHY